MPPDYSGQNLCGRSFKGQNLEGANFSYADIRGTNFTDANLRKANFTGVKAGLHKRWALLLVLLSWLLSGISGYLLLLNGVLIAYIFNSSNIIESQVAGWIALIVTVIVYIIIIRQGIGLSFAVALVIAGISAGIFPVAFSFGVAKGVSFTVAGAVALAFTFIESIVVTLTFAVADVLTVVLALIFAVAGALLATAVVVETVGNLVLAGIVAGIGTAVSAYIAWRAMKGDEKYALVRNAAVAIAAIGGTSFRSADLTDANFTGATLKSTDLRDAKLIRTYFHKTKLLDRVRPGNSYLKYPQVRQLILTGQGQDKNLDRFNLRGINLKGALLKDASFIQTDLTHACLQDTDLSRAKLVKTQLHNTDFTGATLSGVYIGHWNITNETNFRGVKCEYVYTRLPTKENPNPLRKPDNNAETFADGDFADFIQPIFDTLDLYHNQGVDPRAIAISFKELAENNPDAELEIVAMEKRGEDKFLLRAKTAPEADKSELSAEYFKTYNQIKALAEKEIKLLLAEKDSQISRLEIMVMTALERPSFYSNTQIKEVGNMTNNQGGFSVGGDIGGNVNNVQGNNNRAVQGDNNQVIQGDGNQVGVGAEATISKDDIVKLLEELQTLVLEAELPEETKEEVSEEISAAKKATEKEEPKKNIALANLESVAQTLEKTNKTVDAGQKLWSKAKPIIVKVASWLGAAAGSYLLKL
ncbi:MAG: hypothetical protein HC815_17215 [Richelia sp. RM1_1_1]|nr:hypothetical protein [Richelia sp. RM1_1_1]